jgi:methionyl-tRNA formyltransferase
LDAAVVAAYGLILPPSMLQAPLLGCLNIHASLLPRWRGAAPIQAAILAGDAETGVTIMQMDAGLDTGAMLLREAVPITPRTTADDLHDVLARIGAALIVRALDERPAAVPQPAEGATYAAKLTREDGRIDWTLDSDVLDRRIRALNPWPGTVTMLDGQPLKILAAAPAEGFGAPGTVLDAHLTIACGSGALRAERVQRPGRAAMAAEVFLHGARVPPGTVLG